MCLAYVALGCAAVVWGLAFPIMKFAVERLGALDVGVSRMTFGAAGGLGLLLLARRDVASIGPALRRHAPTLLLGFRHGRPTWTELSGPLTLAVAPISWGFYTVLSKPILAELRPLQLNAVTLLGGFLLLVPWASGETLARLRAGTLAEWGAVLYLGLLTMAVAYALWYFGLSRIGAAATGATALGIPLVGVAGSWLLLGESLGVVVLVAGILILGGLHLVLGARRG